MGEPMSEQGVGQALVKPNAVPAIAQTKLQAFWKVNQKHIMSVTASNDQERIMRVTYSLLYRTPKLIECTPFSLLNGIVLAHQMGLVLNTPEVSLVPFGREATLIIGYQGKVKLALASKLIRSVETELVLPGEEFVYRRTQDGLQFCHVPRWELRVEASEANLIGAYCQLGTTGGVQTRFCSLAEILAARARSRGYQFQIQKGGKDTPWITDFGAMALKTAVHRAMKLAPQDATMGLSNAIDDHEQGGPAVIAEGLDPSQFRGEDTEEPLVKMGNEAQRQVAEKKLEDLGVNQSDADAALGTNESEEEDKMRRWQEQEDAKRDAIAAKIAPKRGFGAKP